MKTTPECPQCRAQSRLLFTATDLNRKVSKDGFDYYRCGNCGLVFLWPLPTDLSAFYPPAYHEIPSSTDDLRPGLEREAYKIEAITANTSGRRLLEIGPSYGRFAFLAKSAGFDVDAFELDPACCKFLNEVVGIRAMHTNDIVASMHAADSYDVIALWHSIEHLPDPWTLLDAASGKVKDNGLLVVASPNPDSLQFSLFGKHWVHLDAPRHVELIPPGVLKGRIDKAGFDCVGFSTSDQGALDCNGLGWQVSPEHVFRNHPLWHATRRIWLRLIRMFVSPIEGTGKRGAAYTMVFKKTTGKASEAR